jgi:1-acyl-sn-glycerol-3-phosphate acyltransferase
MPEVAFQSPTRAAARMVAYGAFTATMIPVQALALRLGFRAFAKRFPAWYHRTCLPLLGLKVRKHGQRETEHPVLFACNHVSYLDIAVLGATLPGASFVAKSEVGRWPFFGTLARLQRTVFVDRAARRQTSAQRDEMTRRLEQGDDLILFPEGTSHDGNRVLPFKSALFSVAEKRPHGRPLTVQPVSLTYTRLDDQPMGRYLRPFVAWYGDMDLLPHIWEFLGLGTVTAEVTFHPPVTLDEIGSRKALAQHCHACVARGVAEMLRGRADEAEAADGGVGEPEADEVAADGDEAEPDGEPGDGQEAPAEAEAGRAAARRAHTAVG